MTANVDEEPVDPSDELLFYCLGGGNEVGRSCHIIQYKGKTVMVRVSSTVAEPVRCVAANTEIAGCRYASRQRRLRSSSLLRRV